MLKVNVNFDDNLYTKKILEVNNVPCLCKISSTFEIDFLEAIPQVTGKVLNWNHKDIDARIPAGAGGDYTHYKFSMISISKMDKNLYIIEKLSMFDLWSGGWINIIENREYTELIEEGEPDWLKNL
ncbi:hypothetical protein [Acinetobacter bereziniae]|uniref:Uncharacterized protein n=1 Tax=Acinetobacter bereziniae NIPH 3 TaxID=1217651 RepID=N8YN73_ACIBZ|nr:hypothetical protein [Acinetobacter bereziniae]ENV22794.1 hypothetical protein F963_01044 [Acinetobacter bereziniae NIPH 3]MCV2442583.1 hypothetical protein [Acinetobacter bereziniae]